MIHNIVTDKNGDEHQAVLASNCLGSPCADCSLWKDDNCHIPHNESCFPAERQDGISVIYKRRIKIGDIKR